MSQWPLPPARLLHKEIVGGPLCFHREHNIGSQDGRIPRYSDSHSCVRCIAALTEGRFSIDVHKIEKRHRRNFLTFWSLVDIQGPDECWEWQGDTNTFAIPRHWTSGRQFAAYRTAVWMSHGDIGRLPIKRLCENPKCCNPLHYRVKGVAHFFNRRHLKEVDLEFNNRKLIGETSLFLQTMQAQNPIGYRKIEAINDLWIQARIDSGQALNPHDMAQKVIDNF